MTEEKWSDILAKIDEKYGIDERVTDKNKEDFTTVERVVFTGPVGKIKIERVSQPRRLNTKTHYTKRAGVASAVEVEYDHNEIIHAMHVYRWDDAKNVWAPVHADAFV